MFGTLKSLNLEASQAERIYTIYKSNCESVGITPNNDVLEHLNRLRNRN